MMIKYRVHEVARDLNIPNKDVIETLQKYTGETKKHMTALTENELDLVFEAFTQKNSSADLNAYFAEAEKRPPLVEAEKPDVAIEPEKAAASPAKKAAAPAAKAARRQPAPQNGRRAAPQQQHGAQAAPAARQDRRHRQPAQKRPKPQQSLRMESSGTAVRPAGRIV
ncbi:MAG TPA: translation initiation factor IF-2, partial [Ruminococcaceae bacterium]|nr:translation initiation factor IF-2 [Oscillospiraceae bacterium]HCB91861.1 translation initiation factor IF-2 [Oscillospiraceae bacterium]